MRRFLALAALAGALVAVPAGPAPAGGPVGGAAAGRPMGGPAAGGPMGEPAAAGGSVAAAWTLSAYGLTWHAPRAVPAGDAAIEFWAGDRLLGRPAASRDRRSFTLPLPSRARALDDLQVRAAGRRLDAVPPSVRLAAPRALPSPNRPASALDPGRPGPYPTVSGEYRLPAVRLPGLPAAAEMHAVVVAP